MRRYLNPMSRRTRHLFFDLETRPIINNVEQDPEPVCFQYAWDDGPTKLLSFAHDMDAILDVLVEALFDERTFIWTWNGSFDWCVLHRWVPELRKLIHIASRDGRTVDAQLLEQLLDLRMGDYDSDGKCKFVKRNNKTHRVGYSLFDAEWYYQFPKHDKHNKGVDSWRLRYAELIDKPIKDYPDEAVLYAKLDVEGLRHIVWSQLDSLDYEQRADFSVFHRAAEESAKALALAKCSVVSFFADEERTTELLDRLHREFADAMDALKSPLHSDIDCPSPERGPCPKCRGLMRPLPISKGRKSSTHFRCMLCGTVARGGCQHRLVTPGTRLSSGKNKGTLGKAKKNTNLLRKLVAAICKEHKLDMPKTPKGGDASVKARDLLKLEAYDPALRKQVTYNRVEKLLSTYSHILPLGFRGSIHYGSTPLISTGRCAVEQPPLQQLPRKGGIRECLVGDEDECLVSCDYATLELRTLAQSCLHIVGWSNLADALNAGVDPHLDLAAFILGLDYKEATRLLDEGDPEVEEWRQLCKIANFGFPGGLQPAAFVDYALGYDKVVPLDLAETLYDNWRRKWPEIVPFFAYIKRSTRKGGITLPGAIGGDAQNDDDELPVFDGMYRRRMSFTEAANFHFQGPAARGAKQALVDVSYACYADETSPLYGVAEPALFVHDEIILRCKNTPEIRTRVALELQRLMVKAMQRYNPGIIILAEPVAMIRWLKGAKPVWKDGYLQCTPEKKAA